MGVVSSCHKTPIVIPMMTSLTPQQIAIIQSTWEIPAKNPLDAGEAILLAFFEKYPKNIEKFQAFKNTPLLSLKGTPGSRSHAGRVITIFDDTVQSLSNENYVEHLESIWMRVGDSRQSFEELREVLISVLVDTCSLNEEAQVAWQSLLDIIYHNIYGKVDEKTSY